MLIFLNLERCDPDQVIVIQGKLHGFIKPQMPSRAWSCVLGDGRRVCCQQKGGKEKERAPGHDFPLPGSGSP